MPVKGRTITMDCLPSVQRAGPWIQILYNNEVEFWYDCDAPAILYDSDKCSFGMIRSGSVLVLYQQQLESEKKRLHSPERVTYCPVAQPLVSGIYPITLSMKYVSAFG